MKKFREYSYRPRSEQYCTGLIFEDSRSSSCCPVAASHSRYLQESFNPSLGTTEILSSVDFSEAVFNRNQKRKRAQEQAPEITMLGSYSYHKAAPAIDQDVAVRCPLFSPLHSPALDETGAETISWGETSFRNVRRRKKCARAIIYSSQMVGNVSDVDVPDTIFFLSRSTFSMQEKKMMRQRPRGYLVFCLGQGQGLVRKCRETGWAGVCKGILRMCKNSASIIAGDSLTASVDHVGPRLHFKLFRSKHMTTHSRSPKGPTHLPQQFPRMFSTGSVRTKIFDAPVGLDSSTRFYK